MRRFAFLVHPRHREDMERVERRLPREKVAEIKAGWSAFEYIRLEYAGANGSVYVTPFTTVQMERLPREYVQEKVLEAGRLAVEEGAEIVGLGAMTSVVTRGGQWMQSRVTATVTNGNALTAAVVADQVRSEFGDQLGSHRVAVVGGGGSVGLACAKLLARECKSLLLIGRYRRNLVRALGQLPPGATADISDRLASLQSSSIVILATASSKAVLFAEHLRPGTTVFDVTEPSNLSRDCIEAGSEGRVRLLRAGKVAAEGVDLTRIDTRIPLNTVYACLAESIVYALDDRFNQDSVLPPSVEYMERVFEAARGFGLVPSTAAH